MMAYYINNISTFDLLKKDIKELIPNMNMRRRMSHFVKMGVSTGIETLYDFGESVDAIITSTSLGCLADSEKFLKSIIENQERTLNPTPFIQSTFNTIGSQIGLITKNHCYNMTYSQRSVSFESAMLDAILRIDLQQSENILIGAIDEITPTQQEIFRRLKIAEGECYEGAIFFVLTKEPRDSSVAKVELVSENCDEKNYNENTCIRVSESNYKSSFSASAFLFGEMVEMVNNGEFSSVTLVNDTVDKELFRLKISTL